MIFSRALSRLHPKHLSTLLVLAAISIICVAFSMTSGDEFDIARREILLRRIGHEILLQSGDSTSRVLPVKQIADQEYQVVFEKAFAFSPDSLVHTTSRLLANEPLGSDYVVTVLNCADSSVAYGYAITGNKKDDIIACLGRTQPKACYLLNIKFQSAATGTTKIGYGLGSLALIAFAGYFLLRRAKPQAVLPGNAASPEDHPVALQHSSTNLFTLGSMSFDADMRTLAINDTTTELTKTEARVLRIFAASPNEAIERSRLQKEIWEDEGVIVGRSLDVFISKLRKKLEPDPSVKIAVIRGKGYKLEISPQESFNG